MNKELLERYADLKEKEKLIKSQIEDIAPEIMQMLEDTGVDNPKIKLGERGTFTVVRKVSYEHSDKVKQAEQNIKTMKANEIAEGTVKEKVTSFLQYKSSKKEEL